MPSVTRSQKPLTRSDRSCFPMLALLTLVRGGVQTVYSLSVTPAALNERAQIRLCKVQNFVPFAVEHRFDQVNAEALCLLEVNRGRHREFIPGDLDTQQCGTRMVQSSADGFLQIPRILHSASEDAASLGQHGKVRIHQVGTEADHSR